MVIPLEARGLSKEAWSDLHYSPSTTSTTFPGTLTLGRPCGRHHAKPLFQFQLERHPRSRHGGPQLLRPEDLPKGSIDTSGTIGGTSPSNTFQGQLSELKGKVNDRKTNVKCSSMWFVERPMTRGKHRRRMSRNSAKKNNRTKSAAFSKFQQQHALASLVHSHNGEFELFRNDLQALADRLEVKMAEYDQAWQDHTPDVISISEACPDVIHS